MRRFKCFTIIRVVFLVLGFLASFSAIGDLPEGQPDQGLFWSIEGEQGNAGYLLGTIHSEDPRVLEFTDEFLATLQACSVFAMELVPNLPTLARLAETMNLPAGQELSSVIGQERFELVAAALAKYGVPEFMAVRLKPWAAMITLSVPAPETGFFMDFSLSLRASGGGLKVIGLETLDEQLDFLENMPLEHQLTMLDQAVLEVDRVGELHDEMVDLYLRGDMDALHEVTDTQLAELGEEARRYFVDKGIIARNQHMLNGMLKALDEGRVFTAVGALHLAGEQGLVKLLRDHGYRLSPLPSPFPVAE